jgi:hypothetical protein
MKTIPMNAARKGKTNTQQRRGVPPIRVPFQRSPNTGTYVITQNVSRPKGQVLKMTISDSKIADTLVDQDKQRD